MGFSLKGLFKKKPGGSAAGNLFRKVTVGLADKVGLGGVVELINPVPAAPAPVQAAAQEVIEKAAALPAVSPALAQSFALSAAQDVIKKGATQEEADAVSHEVLVAAQKPAAVPVNSFLGGSGDGPVKPTTSVSINDLDAVLAASKALGIPADEVPAAVEELARDKGKTKADILAILKDGAVAAKDAMVQSWLDKTKAGQDTKREAIWGQLEKYAPYAVGGIALVWFLKRQGVIK